MKKRNLLFIYFTSFWFFCSGVKISEIILDETTLLKQTINNELKTTPKDELSNKIKNQKHLKAGLGGLLGSIFEKSIGVIKDLFSQILPNFLSPIKELFSGVTPSSPTSSTPTSSNNDEASTSGGSSHNNQDCLSMNDYECRVFEMVNEYRRSKGKSVLEADPVAVEAAQYLALCNQRNSIMKHTSRQCGSMSSRYQDAMRKVSNIGARLLSENIARGQSSPEVVMNSWKKSKGHNNNMLNSQARYIGVGFIRGNWVQVFSR